MLFFLQTQIEQVDFSEGGENPIPLVHPHVPITNHISFLGQCLFSEKHYLSVRACKFQWLVFLGDDETNTKHILPC